MKAREYKDQIRKNWERRAAQAELRLLNYYRQHPDLPDGGFVMDIALRYHASMIRAEKIRQK